MTGLNQFTTRWTPEAKAKAVRLYSNDYSYSQIAAEINSTRNAVGGLLKRLGLIRNPTGKRVDPTPTDLIARTERKRRLKREWRQRQRAKLTNGDRIPSETWKPREAAVEPLNIPFAEMKFGRFCAYPVGDDTRAMIYCGHECGVDVNGKRASYCQDHYRLTYVPPKTKVKTLVKLAEFLA
jgi:hypothetical protein